MSRKRELDFAAVAPWLCAILVMGVEAAEKALAPAIGVAASSLALLFLILAGSALWSPITSRTEGTGLSVTERCESAAEYPCSEVVDVNDHRLPIPSDCATPVRFSS